MRREVARGTAAKGAACFGGGGGTPRLGLTGGGLCGGPKGTAGRLGGALEKSSAIGGFCVGPFCGFDFSGSQNSFNGGPSGSAFALLPAGGPGPGGGFTPLGPGRALGFAGLLLRAGCGASSPAFWALCWGLHSSLARDALLWIRRARSGVSCNT